MVVVYVIVTDRIHKPQKDFVKSSKTRKEAGRLDRRRSLREQYWGVHWASNPSIQW
jgi:hypothetical protein